MNNEIINGIGTLAAGEYDRIEINGGAKSTGVVKAKEITVEGLLNAGNILEVGNLVINGRITGKGDIISEKIAINGMLQLNQQNIKVKALICKGTIQCLGSVSGNDIEIDGLCNINNIHGRNLKLKTNNEKVNNLDKAGGVGKIFLQLCNVERCTLNHIECDEIKADNCSIDILKANDIELINNCIVNKIYCNGNMSIDESCKVGEVISTEKKENVEQTEPENKSMVIESNDNAMNKIIMEPIEEFDVRDIDSVETVNANMSYSNESTPLLDITDTDIVYDKYNNIEKILLAYKEEKITMQESEKYLQNYIKSSFTDKAPECKLPWDDDDNLRIVAYKGTSIIKRSNPNLTKLTVEYLGEVLAVDCMGSLVCGTVHGNVRSQASVTCKNVDGSIRAVENVNCGDVKGNVHSGGGVACGNVDGDVDAGAEVSCGNVGGDVEVNGDIHCSSVMGNVYNRYS